jgi:cytidylate kinase
MSIITVSRGSYSRGREVAEKLAQRLGHQCVSREGMLEASQQCNIPETDLVRAVTDALRILERFTYGKERYVAYVRAAVLRYARKDNVVYHGYAGHLFLRQVPTVLKVRIIADLEERVREAMRRDNTSPDEARLVIARNDEERRKWGLQLYAVDTWDSDNYDMVLNVTTMTVDDAVDLVFHNAKRPCFQTTPESQKIIDNLALAAQVQAALVEDFPTAEVSAKDGRVFVALKGPVTQAKKLTARARSIVDGIEEVEEASIDFVPFEIFHSI